MHSLYLIIALSAATSPELVPLSLAGTSQIQSLIKAHHSFWLQIILTAKHVPSSVPQSTFLGPWP